MKYLALVALMTATSPDSPAVIFAFILLAVVALIGWGWAIISAWRIRNLKKQIESMQTKIKNLHDQHNANLKKIQKLESDLRRTTNAINQLTLGMKKIDKMFDIQPEPDDDETLS